MCPGLLPRCYARDVEPRKLAILGLCLLFGAGCSLERQGLLPTAGADAGNPDARQDADVTDSGECRPTDPPDEICDGLDNDCNADTPDGHDDPRLADLCDDADDADLCVDDQQTCVAAAIVCAPGASGDKVEVCGAPGEEAIDEDCDGIVDEASAEGTLPYYPDVDGDGHGDASVSATVACFPPPMSALSNDDCDDRSALAAPGLVEECNGIDDDCDGAVDEEGCPCPAVVNGGRTYLFCTSSVSWTSARDGCAGAGFKLVRIDDAAENSFVNTQSQLLASDNWWIGYNDRSDEGSWEWVGGGGGYTHWNGGEPNDGDIWSDEDCGEIRGDGSWNDRSCDGDSPYVCEPLD